MQQDIHIHPTEIFEQVLASEAKLTDAHLNGLQTLLYSFPQCGLLYAIQARSGNATELNAAAARFSDSVTLQKIVQWPDSLPAVNASQIIYKKWKPESLAEPVAEVTDEPANFKVIDEIPQSQSYYEVFEEVKTEPVVKNAEPVREPELIVENEEVLRSGIKHEPLDETQKLIIENIASTDFFVFDRAFVEREESQAAIEEEEIALQEPAPVQQATPPPPAEEGQVTRYHDEKMPYSFMWWLDKTRNKFSGIYQPFAAPANTKEDRQPPIPVPVETIPHEVIESRKKEEELVERFIQEDPQIKPPSSDKLDSENKARLSAEDQEELITETLARIYADQMLYSKAIAAYKILMLKNPEKRRYFATQIEILEKKIN
ncbi:hypothetical protein [Mucilaginibacter terrae]|uniref:hypothetical protein n=1 Tax=Mucilaginibacter terrae TaxID=1955052 RepID=UPI00289A5842|nr:hypothetical protein [Mucilaginibacter terrae]